MARWLIVLVAVEGNMGSVPSTHIVVKNCLVPRNLTPSSGVHEFLHINGTQTSHMHIYTYN